MAGRLFPTHPSNRVTLPAAARDALPTSPPPSQYAYHTELLWKSPTVTSLKPVCGLLSLLYGDAAIGGLKERDRIPAGPTS